MKGFKRAKAVKKETWSPAVRQARAAQAAAMGAAEAAKEAALIAKGRLNKITKENKQ